MRLLIVAADGMEFSGIAARVKNCRAAGIAAGWSRTGTLGAHEVLLAANGAGGKRAAAAVAAGLAGFRADAVVSTGFCGALDPGLEVAEVVVGTCVAGGSRVYPAAPMASGNPAKQGRVESIDHVAQTAAEKSMLFGRNSIAVEMEAAGVAAAAERAGLLFFCIRSVTDLASEDMANNFNAALRPDGHFGTMNILVGVLRHPSARLPELIRLRKRCVRAAQALGEFFADSRF
jgi:adenosylhomocysteine nucleosidase